ncbi:MAG TPA: hypothetical protein VFW96_16320 [Thermomicrobiales bacterium]|nr:hypothetical protein [Thermomicrobiales bacterium]
MATRYTVRYCCDDRPAPALIVEDERGTAYLFSGGTLQSKVCGADASARLADLLRRTATWTSLSPPPSCSLDELRRLGDDCRPRARQPS